MENEDKKINKIHNIRIFSSVMSGLVILLYICGFYKTANCMVLFSLLGTAAYLYLKKDFTYLKQVIPFSKTVSPFINRLYNFLEEAIISFVEAIIAIVKVIFFTAILLAPLFIMLSPELADFNIFRVYPATFEGDNVFSQILNETTKGDARIIEELYKIQYMILTGISSATIILAILIIRTRKPKK